MMFSKQHIFDSFEGFFSKTAIKFIDDEWRLVGKFGQIVPLDDGNWDLFVGPDLSVRKLHSVMDKLQRAGQFRELDGEAYTQVTLEALLPLCADFHRHLGIRKKATLSEAHKAKMHQFSFKGKDE